MTKPPQKRPPKPSDERGDFRSMYSVMFDSPEYEALSLAASHLLVTVKHSLGPAGIGQLEIATLQRRSKLTDPHLFTPARDELIDGLWIFIEHRIWWLRNGLRFEPSMSQNNDNHVRSVQRWLNGLPKLHIVNEMADYYRRLGWPLVDPFPGVSGNGIEMGSRSHRDPIEIPSQEGIPSRSHRDPTAITEPLTLTLTEPLTESDSETESETRARTGSASPGVNGGTPDFDGYTPTDSQRARASELGYEVGDLCRAWRANRKSIGLRPMDIAADFDAWIEREPVFRSSNGGSGHDTDPPRPYVAPYREPDEPTPSDDERAEAQRILRDTKEALANDPTPEPRKRRHQLTREEQLALARGGKP